MPDIKLWQGDCLELMKKIPDGSIDFVLTDPPYQLTACKWDKLIPFEAMWKELKRIIKPNGAVCLFGSEPFSSALRMSNLKWFKYDWVWHKNRPSGFALAKKRPMSTHELISVFYNKQSNYYPIKEKRDRQKKYESKLDYGKLNINTKNNLQGLKRVSAGKVDKLRYPTSVKKFSCENNSHGNKKHPTQKPVALLEYLIRTYTLEGETVLDFTAGSFSTGVAAVNLNRSFIGIELDKDYFEIGKKRVEDAQRINNA